MTVNPLAEPGTSKADAAYTLLKARILDGSYGAGYRIVVDQLVRETGLSNIPWREAIRRLEAEGWIEIVRNAGARVATFDVEDHRHMLELIARIEGFVTGLAAPNVTSDDIELGRDLDRRMREALEQFDPDGFADLNRRFHAIFHARCGDAHIRSLLASELQRFDVIRSTVHSVVPGRARSSIDEHETLLDLVEGRAPAAEIEDFARLHKLGGLREPRVVVSSANGTVDSALE